MKDDWEKPRHQGVHLSAPEIARVRKAFDECRHYSEIARELKCSSKTALNYYARFRGYARPRGRPRTRQPDLYVPRPRRAVDRTARFYTSNFEIC